ncbi:MAG: undecaprenyl-diphosphate phosphatase [Clostridia bacterium]|nr:undecaprenyl-diphosphate phosphatase [Clostridia bacterium]
MNIIEILKAILFGLVEGVTEWLPISSTGHMILLEQVCWFNNVSEAFREMFEVVIQLGAILAVVVIFWKKIWPLTRNKKSGKIGFSMPIIMLWVKIIIACIPAAIIGLAFDDKINELFYNPVCVAIALIVVGIAFILVESMRAGKKATIRSIYKLDYKTVVFIGIFQVIAAVFPGTSRSGATILGALMLGVSRKTAAEFTFFLAIPVMFGASLLKLVKLGFAFTGAEMAVLGIAMVVAFLVSLAIIKFLLGFIRKHSFKGFGWYRIVLGLIVLGAGFLIK